MKAFLLSLFLPLIISIHVQAGELPMGGRMGLHGMVLYGNAGEYFIDHIPMEHAPHDFQIIAKVQMTDALGKIFSGNLADAGYTLKPSGHFSLNDFMSGHLKNFKADLFSGNFEQDGVLKAAQLQIQILQILTARQIPKSHAQATMLFKTSIAVFEVNVITPEHNFQSIKNQKTGQTLWCVKGPDFFNNCD